MDSRLRGNDRKLFPASRGVLRLRRPDLRQYFRRRVQASGYIGLQRALQRGIGDELTVACRDVENIFGAVSERRDLRRHETDLVRSEGECDLIKQSRPILR